MIFWLKPAHPQTSFHGSRVRPDVNPEAAACPGECAICDLENFHQGYTPPLGVSREPLQTDYDVGRNSIRGSHRILDKHADDSCLLAV